MTCEEYREKCLNETIQKIEDSIKEKERRRANETIITPDVLQTK